MPDTPDLTPPPEEPMPDETRSRIRHRIVEAATTDTRPGGRWVIPTLAAAAVIAVIAGTYAVSALDDDGAGRTDSLQPAATSTGIPSLSPTPTLPPPTPTPGPSRSDQPTPTVAPSTAPSTAAMTPPPLTATPGPPTGHISCPTELGDLGDPSLRGATVTAERGYGPWTTYLYETKSTWIVCDDFAAQGGGRPTLLAPHDESKPYEPDVSTLAISENSAWKPDGAPGDYQLLAAGRDFAGVRAISYTFPDKHTEQAVVGQNGLWSMTYLPADGILADPKTNTFNLDPIQVTVDYTDGETKVFTLQWGLDTCAQVNHGC